MKKRRIGMYSSWFGYKLTTEEQMKQIKDAGFDSVCFWWGSEGFNGPKEDQVEFARKNDLYIENIHMPFVWAEREITTNPQYKYASCNDFWVDNEDGEYALLQSISALEECADYEIPVAVTHITIGHNPHPINSIGLDRIETLVDIAEKRNVIIAAENTHNPEYLDAIFKEIKSDKLKFCYDCGHDFLYGNNFTSIVNTYSDKLTALHLHDNHGTKDDHLVPGDGILDFTQIKKILLQSGYQGDLMFEIAASKDQADTSNSCDYLDRAYKTIKSLFDDILYKEKLADE